MREDDSAVPAHAHLARGVYLQHPNAIVARAAEECARDEVTRVACAGPAENVAARN